MFSKHTTHRDATGTMTSSTKRERIHRKAMRRLAPLAVAGAVLVGVVGGTAGNASAADYTSATFPDGNRAYVRLTCIANYSGGYTSTSIRLSGSATTLGVWVRFNIGFNGTFNDWGTITWRQLPTYDQNLYGDIIMGNGAPLGYRAQLKIQIARWNGSQWIYYGPYSVSTFQLAWSTTTYTGESCQI
jgi:hypothetical protein